jgi:drug/metabolite transporter (DMT)-like permease
MLFVYGGDGRSLSNLIELPILAVLIAALAWLKGPIQRKTPDGLQPYWFLLAGVALGLTCYLAFPGLDE